MSSQTNIIAAPNESDDELFDDEFLKKLEYLHLLARSAFSGQIRADRKTQKVGSGIQFADHRRYSAGDDFRYIDWNIYGRMDKLLLRLFEEEEDLHIYILLDISTSMRLGSPRKIDYAKKAAAALTYVGLGNLDRVGLSTFSDELKGRVAPARGKQRIFSVLEFLRNAQPGGVTDLSECCKSFVHQTKRKGLVVVISDFYDPAGFAAGLNKLRYHKFEPFILQVFDPKEANPPLFGDMTIVDCETGEEKAVTVSKAVLEAYKKEHARYLDELSRFCTERAVPYFRTSTQVPFDDLILEIFRKGGFLR